MSRGRPLLGTIVHSKSTPEERRALDDLLGRPSTRGQRLTLNLAELAQTLRLAGIAAQLEDAVVVIRGPVENQREQTDRRRDEWTSLFAATRARVAEHPALVEWVNALARDGTLKRLSRGDLAADGACPPAPWLPASTVAMTRRRVMSREARAVARLAG
jgi:hypothetical protein